MENLLGKISASLIEKDPAIPKNLVARINENVKPPTPVSPDDIYVRAMYIVSDRVNSYGGCFPADEHSRLIELMIDSPVLIGHRKDSLPIARNFHAETIQKDQTNWIKVYFYWLKNSEKGEDLKNNIDGGIYKECSISFIFNFPECSICGSDIRECRHRPLEKYETDDGQQLEAYFNYRQVLKVLETSLVYRGSVQDTSITDDLFFSKMPPPATLEKSRLTELPAIKRIWEPTSLDAGRKYLVMPAYESIRVCLEKTGNDVRLFFGDGTRFSDRNTDECLRNITLPDGEFLLDVRLIGYRGKERQPVSDLIKHLHGEKSTVRRTEMKIYDLLRCDNQDMTEEIGGTRRRKLERLFSENNGSLVPAETIAGNALSHAAKNHSTRYGMEIFALDSAERFTFTHHKLVPLRITSRQANGKQFQYSISAAVDGDPVPIDDAIITGTEFQIGDTVEAEVLSAYRSETSIKLVHPQIIDCGGKSDRLQDIELVGGIVPDTSQHCRYSVYRPDEDLLLLLIPGDERQDRFLVHNFSDRLLDIGRGFLCEPLESDDFASGKPCGEGPVRFRDAKGENILYELDGFLQGHFIFRTVILNNNRRLLFRKIVGHKTHEASCGKQ